VAGRHPAGPEAHTEHHGTLVFIPILAPYGPRRPSLSTCGKASFATRASLRDVPGLDGSLDRRHPRCHSRYKGTVATSDQGQGRAHRMATDDRRAETCSSATTLTGSNREGLNCVSLTKHQRRRATYMSGRLWDVTIRTWFVSKEAWGR